MPTRRKTAPEPEAAPDPASPVMLMRGCIEDRMLRTGAVVEVMVYAPGTVIPLAEALARNIDDYVPYIEPVLVVDDVFSGPGSPVRDPWPAAE